MAASNLSPCIFCGDQILPIKNVMSHMHVSKKSKISEIISCFEDQFEVSNNLVFVVMNQNKQINCLLDQSEKSEMKASQIHEDKKEDPKEVSENNIYIREESIFPSKVPDTNTISLLSDLIDLPAGDVDSKSTQLSQSVKEYDDNKNVGEITHTKNEDVGPNDRFMPIEKSPLPKTEFESYTDHKKLCKCGKSFKSDNGLMLHVNTQHAHLKDMEEEDTTKNVVCTECGEICKNKGKPFGIAFHMKNHHPKEKHCTYENCNFSSKYQRSIKDHNKRVHLKLPILKDHVCAVCERAFITKSGLYRHSLDHFGGRPFKCEICGKAFKTKDHLKDHAETHTDNLKYICNSCGRGFKNNGAFWNHKKLHKRGLELLQGQPKHLVSEENGEKITKCLGCPDLVRLDTKEKLDEHMALVHPEGSKYWCDQCNYNFLSDDKLMIHNKKYHGSQGPKIKRAKID